MLPRPSSSAAMAACLSLTMQGGRCNDEHGFSGNNLDQRWPISPLQMIHEEGPARQGPHYLINFAPLP